MVNREGFWQSDREPWLPFPVKCRNWPGRAKFIAALKAIEAKVTTVIAYRGVSSCRLCKASVGNKEYVYGNEARGTWKWPSGFLHYVEEHGVRPSLAFEEFIVGDITTVMPNMFDTFTENAVQSIAAAEDDLILKELMKGYKC